MRHNKMESDLWWRIPCTRRSARALRHCQALLSQSSLGVPATLGFHICPWAHQALCQRLCKQVWPLLPMVLPWLPLGPAEMHLYPGLAAVLPHAKGDGTGCSLSAQSLLNTVKLVKYYKVPENVCRCELIYTTVEFYWLDITLWLGYRL